MNKKLYLICFVCLPCQKQAYGHVVWLARNIVH